MNLIEHRSHKLSILYDADTLANVDESLFEPKLLAELGLLEETQYGRAATQVFQFNQNKLVLRHYRRGGAVARLIKDKYCFLGLKRTRAWRELTLLAFLAKEKLPVPKPFAARVIRFAGVYSADIITHQIPYARTLAQYLSEAMIPQEIWKNIGKTIRRFHDLEVFHADLNAHNIMLNREFEVFLIDFDKGEIKSKGSSAWKLGNLNRLLRSLQKLTRIQDTFNFSEDDWQHLVHAYKNN